MEANDRASSAMPKGSKKLSTVRYRAGRHAPYRDLGRNSRSLQADLTHDRPIDPIGLLASRLSDSRFEIYRWRRRRHRIVNGEFVALILRRMNLDEKFVANPRRFHVLADHAHQSAYRNFTEQSLDVFGIEMHTTVTHIASDAIGLVSAVNEIARPAETEGVGAKRIIRPCGNEGRKVGSFLMDRCRRIPDGISLLGNDPGRADRR